MSQEHTHTHGKTTAQMRGSQRTLDKMTIAMRDIGRETPRSQQAELKSRCNWQHWACLSLSLSLSFSSKPRARTPNAVSCHRGNQRKTKMSKCGIKSAASEQLGTTALNATLTSSVSLVLPTDSSSRSPFKHSNNTKSDRESKLEGNYGGGRQTFLALRLRLRFVLLVHADGRTLRNTGRTRDA